MVPKYLMVLIAKLIVVVPLGRLGFRYAAYYVSAARYSHVPLGPGNAEVPRARTLTWNERSALTDSVVSHWAAQPLPDWREQGKVNAPRALMGRFMSRLDVDAANEYIRAATPWGKVGSTWQRHPEGDYDFTLAGLIPILFLFGDDPAVLYPATVDHLLDVLLTVDGGDPLVTVPRTYGIVRDTENHLLMTEGSRYLKNRWLALHGATDEKYDNERNGLEQWLLELLDELQTAGLYEFNSIPYEGYTLTALLNLEAFGSDRVRAAAREVLDRMNWQYALGSLSFRRFAPFRRQYRQAGITALDADYHTALAKAWMSMLPDGPSDLRIRNGIHQALWACWSPYRLPDDTARWMTEKPDDYFARIGHGPGGSPEIYSGGPGYLLSAGGANRGRRSLIVARPITLLLDDGAEDLSDVLYLSGAGDDFMKWNNTGVYRNFAVSAGPVHIPEGWTVEAERGLWSAYRRPVQGGAADLCVMVHSRADLGVVYLRRSDNAQAALDAVAAANGDARVLTTSFTVPGGERIEYDTSARRGRWVIRGVDGEKLDRRYDRWPLMSLMGGRSGNDSR